MMSQSFDELFAHKKYLASGCCRRVYDLGNGYVLKEAKSDVGIQNNSIEKTIYITCPEKLKKHLAKIVMSRDSWLIMKKYNNGFPKSNHYTKKLKKLQGEFEESGIHALDLFLYGEPNWGNLRLDRSGRIIIIDYGDFSLKS